MIEVKLDEAVHDGEPALEVAAHVPEEVVGEERDMPAVVQIIDNGGQFRDVCRRDGRFDIEQDRLPVGCQSAFRVV